MTAMIDKIAHTGSLADDFDHRDFTECKLVNLKWRT